MSNKLQPKVVTIAVVDLNSCWDCKDGDGDGGNGLELQSYIINNNNIVVTWLFDQKMKIRL